jgi:serine/threonine protein phosphatase PrpC
MDAVPLPVAEGAQTVPRSPAWRNLAPSEPWLPADLEVVFPELVSHSYQDNCQFEVAAFGDWRIAAATRRGQYHAHHGSFREDAMAVKVSTAPDCAVVCVADGVGSSSLSRVASEWLSRRAADKMAADLARLASEPQDPELAVVRQVLEKAIRCAGEEFQTLVSNANRQIKDFRCTLVLAALVQRPSGPWLAATQIGDGALLALLKNGTVSRLAEADSGDVACEITAYMPDHLVHGPYTLTGADILKPEILVRRISEGSDAISKFLQSALSAKVEAFKSRGEENENEGLRHLLADGLNRIVAAEETAMAASADAGALSMETRSLMASSPKGEEIQRLNRLILQDTFPAELACKQIKAVWRKADDLTAVVVATDGVDDAFFAGERLIFRQMVEGVSEPGPSFKSQPVQGPILSDSAPAAALEKWLGFERRGEFDDRTVAVLYRQPLDLGPEAAAKLK